MKTSRYQNILQMWTSESQKTKYNFRFEIQYVNISALVDKKLYDLPPPPSQYFLLLLKSFWLELLLHLLEHKVKVI